MTGPIAVTLDEFLNLPIEEKPPLLGTAENAAVVAGGLVLLGGQAGLGKTTLIVDAIFHMASGLDWLEFPVNRPLHILVIENEGPLRMFQQKLAAKRRVWGKPLTGSIHVQTAAWGYFSFADLDHHTRIKEYLDEHRIDLVIGDPIGTLGMEGVGSPEDTRNFVRQLIPLGLFDYRSFIFPVHFTKEPRKDEINQISGAWGGHLDTLMVVKGTRRKDELRLSFPKLRWWSEALPAPMILGKVYNTQTFEILRREGDQEPLEERIAAVLEDHPWLTSAETAKAIEGGARAADVKKALEARTELFRWESGADHGRSAKAIVWALIPDSGTSQTNKTAQQSQTGLFPDSGTSRDESDESLSDEMSHSLFLAQRDESDESKSRPLADKTDNSSQPPPLKGGMGTSRESDTELTRPEPGTSQPAEAIDRLAEVRDWITNGGWMTNDLNTAILEQFPNTSPYDLTTLREHAAACEADELGSTPLQAPSTT